MPITPSTFVHQGNMRLGELRRLLAALESSFSKHHQNLQELEASRHRALDQLTLVNLPNLSQEAFNDVRTFTGYGQFHVRNPLARIDEERRTLAQTIAQIEADPRFQRADELINPTSGELILKIEAFRRQCQPVFDAAHRYEALPHFLILIERNYGTDEYPLRPWNLDYYLDWKNADEIVEQLGKENFDFCRHDYLHLWQARDQMKRELQTLEQEIAAVHQLVEHHRQASYRLANLPELILQESRLALREHLSFVDRDQLFSWAQGDRSREALIKMLHGVEKKNDYLKQMANHQFVYEREMLQTAIAKLEKKIAKFSRPKYAGMGAIISDAEAAAWLADPRQKLGERRDRFWKNYDRVIVFQEYDRYDYGRDLLWWDLMTDGRVDGSFIPEVREYYTSHPGYDPHSRDYHHAGRTLSSYDSSYPGDTGLVEVS